MPSATHVISRRLPFRHIRRGFQEQALLHLYPWRARITAQFLVITSQALEATSPMFGLPSEYSRGTILFRRNSPRLPPVPLVLPRVFSPTPSARSSPTLTSMIFCQAHRAPDF